MDHSEASRLMASEKYLLDELSTTEIEAVRGASFCLQRVRARRARRICVPRTEQGRTGETNPQSRSHRSSPIPKDRMVVASLRGSCHGDSVGCGRISESCNIARHEGGFWQRTECQRFFRRRRWLAARYRGSTPSVIEAHRGQQFLLPVDIQAQSAFESYVVELQNSAGGVQWSLPVSSESAKNTLTIAGSWDGKGWALRSGCDGPDGTGPRFRSWALRFRFAVCRGGKS